MEQCDLLFTPMGRSKNMDENWLFGLLTDKGFVPRAANQFTIKFS
jgi:hypothetical protein